MDNLSEIRDLASRQHGLATVRQARRTGMTRAAVRHLAAIGEWTPMGPNVLRLAGSAPTHDQWLMAAVLDAGASAVVSHEAAAALWGLPGFPPGPLDVTRRRTNTRMRPMLGEVHESRRLPEGHCTTVRGIPVTTLARTLFDLAGADGISEGRVERAVDNALSRSPALLRRLHRMLDEIGARGRPGIALMRQILAARPAGYIAPASGLEARAIGILEEAGILVERQIDLGGGDWIGRVDLRVIGTNVVVEVDSVVHHTSVSDRERDIRRDAELEAAGLVVVRVTEDEVFHRPWVFESRVRSGMRNGRPGDHFASQLRVG
jgi:hypothetical protein